LAYVGLGSNLNDPVAQIDAGMRALSKLSDTLVERCSSLYRSAPLGRTDQPDFVNAACRLRTILTPTRLMQDLLAIEQTHSRVRGPEAGGPRTLDLDLLLYGQHSCRETGLILPHPRLHERAFVLHPLFELDPDLVIPGHGRVADLLAGCASQRVEKLDN